MNDEIADRGSPRWCFVLYKAGNKETMVRAESTLRRLCERFVKDQYEIIVKDVFNDDIELPPDLLVVPTVIRVAPPPQRRVVGDFSQADKAAEWLGLSNVDLVDGL